jgi:FkbM family methyltransferase
MNKAQEYDDQTIAIMERVLRPDSCCVDVGCHAGVMLDEMLRLSPQGKHWGFEPLPQMFASLTAKYEDHLNIQLCECALSDKSGFTLFQSVRTNPGYSGIKRRAYTRPDEVVDSIEVKMETLDRAIPAEVLISFMKIDVEGAELKVLQGGIGTLIRCKPVIVFEHGLGAAEYYETTPRQIFELLTKEAKLRCFTLSGWLRTQGQSELVRESFEDAFNTGKEYYFVAAP